MTDLKCIEVTCEENNAGGKDTFANTVINETSAKFYKYTVIFPAIV